MSTTQTDAVEQRLVDLASEFVSAQRVLAYHRDRDTGTSPAPREFLTVLRQAPELALVMDHSTSTTHLCAATQADGTARYAVVVVDKVTQSSDELEGDGEWSALVGRRKATELLDLQRPRLIPVRESLVADARPKQSEVYAGR